MIKFLIKKYIIDDKTNEDYVIMSAGAFYNYADIIDLLIKETNMNIDMAIIIAKQKKESTTLNNLLNYKILNNL